uniref:C-type lectin domain-containing protein n=1 Tax=Astyanax mexicanus TaxID=7994 RepID=A0A8B9KVR9_ASTMX
MVATSGSASVDCNLLSKHSTVNINHHLLLLIDLVLSLGCLWSQSSAGFRYYYLVTEPKTWVQAQSYCRQQYTDLATVDNMAEMQQLKGLIPPGFSDSIWIGLKTGSVKHWGWSSGEVLQYAKWSPGQPDNENLEGICGGMYKSGGFVDMFCTNKYQFVCYTFMCYKVLCHIFTGLLCFN